MTFMSIISEMQTSDHNCSSAALCHGIKLLGYGSLLYIGISIHSSIFFTIYPIQGGVGLELHKKI